MALAQRIELPTRGSSHARVIADAGPVRHGLCHGRGMGKGGAPGMKARPGRLAAYRKEWRLSTSGDRRDDLEHVPGFDLRIQILRVTDVFVVEIDIDEAANLAVFIV